ncbi:MAG TPA: hypothetical protein VJN21_05850 [Candidatus Acidoferrales bacterium]|nr:hypothetical protein [Candidatus Acidoferrales bacterium]
MRPRTICLLLVLGVALPASAGDARKDKPYTSSTAKDVRKILWNSPWARVIRTPYFPEGEYGGPPHSTQTIPIGGTISPDQNPDQETIGLPTPDKAPYRPEGAYVIRWASSQTIRHVLLRATILQSYENQAGEDVPIENSDDEYVFVLVSDSPTPLPWMDRDAVMESATLQATSTKEEVSPARVAIARNPALGQNTSVTFYFPNRLGLASH